MRNNGNKIVGNKIRVLKDKKDLMREERIEIEKNRNRKDIVNVIKVEKNVLDEKIGKEIGIGGRKGMILGDRKFIRVEIEGGRRDEKEIIKECRLNGMKKKKCEKKIEIIIEKRILDRLKKGIKKGKMDKRSEFMEFDKMLNKGEIENIERLEERREESDILNKMKWIRMDVVEIIEKKKLMEWIDKMKKSVGEDIERKKC